MSYKVRNIIEVGLGELRDKDIITQRDVKDISDELAERIIKRKKQKEFEKKVEEEKKKVKKTRKAFEGVKL